MSPEEDDGLGDLWCFHGCTMQVSEVPYMCMDGQEEPKAALSTAAEGTLADETASTRGDNSTVNGEPGMMETGITGTHDPQGGGLLPDDGSNGNGLEGPGEWPCGAASVVAASGSHAADDSSPSGAPQEKGEEDDDDEEEEEEGKPDGCAEGEGYAEDPLVKGEGDKATQDDDGDDDDEDDDEEEEEGTPDGFSEGNVKDHVVKDEGDKATEEKEEEEEEKEKEAADVEAFSAATPSSEAPQLSVLIEGLEDALQSRRGAMAAEAELLLGAVSRAAREAFPGCPEAQQDWESIVQADLYSDGSDDALSSRAQISRAALEVTLGTCRELEAIREHSCTAAAAAESAAAASASAAAAAAESAAAAADAALVEPSYEAFNGNALDSTEEPPPAAVSGPIAAAAAAAAPCFSSSLSVSVPAQGEAEAEAGAAARHCAPLEVPSPFGDASAPPSSSSTVSNSADCSSAQTAAPGRKHRWTPKSAPAGGSSSRHSGPSSSSSQSGAAPPDTWGLSKAQFEAKAYGTWWPVKVDEPSGFTAHMRKIGLRVKVSYVLDPTDEWEVDSMEGLRPKDLRKWSEGLAPCLQGVGHCRHRGCLAAQQTGERSSPRASTAPGSTAAGTEGGPGSPERALLSSPRAAGLEPEGSETASSAPEAFRVPLDHIDSASLLHVMMFLDGTSLAMLACTSRALRSMAEDDRVWRAAQVRDGRHPRLGVQDGTWKQAFVKGQAIEANWRRRRCVKTEWNDHSDLIYHIHRLGDMAITSSADGSLRVFALPNRNNLPVITDGDASDDAPETREADPLHDDEAEVHPEVAAFLRPGDPGKRAGSCMELLGHMDHVTCAGTLDGGRTVISSSVDDVFKIWKLPERKCLETRRGVAGPGFCRFAIAERPWGHETPHLVAGSMGGSGVTAWDLVTWQEVTSLEHQNQEFYSVCVPEGTPLILGAAGDSKVHVWDVRQGGKSVAQLDGSRRGSVRCVDAEGYSVVSGGADGTVRMFDRRMWGSIKVLRQHTDLVNVVKLDQKLGLLVSGGDDGKICALRLPSWRACNPISTRVGVLTLDFDHSRLLAGCEDRTMRCWDFLISDDSTYFDADAWAAVARMAEARARSGTTGEMDRRGGAQQASSSSAATSARHARAALASPGAGYPFMDGFHT